MATKPILGITLALVTLVSCVSQRDKDPAMLKNRTSQSAAQITAETNVENSNFDSNVEYVGPKIELIEWSNNFSSDYSEKYTYLIRSWKNKSTGHVQHQLYLTAMNRSGWRRYNSAEFEDTSSLDVLDIGSDVRCSSGRYSTSCRYFETVGTSLSDELLGRHRQTGFRIRFRGQSGHKHVVEVPASYIDGYLRAVYQPV